MIAEQLGISKCTRRTRRTGWPLILLCTCNDRLSRPQRACLTLLINYQGIGSSPARCWSSLNRPTRNRIVGINEHVCVFRTSVRSWCTPIRFSTLHVRSPLSSGTLPTFYISAPTSRPLSITFVLYAGQSIAAACVALFFLLYYKRCWCLVQFE